MMDDVCPPSTGSTVHRRYGGPSTLHVYRFGDHSGGESAHRGEQLRWLSAQLTDSPGGPLDDQPGGGVHIH